eukprot:6204979-Pleurochrysis_carterae.AAC.1
MMIAHTSIVTLWLFIPLPQIAYALSLKLKQSLAELQILIYNSQRYNARRPQKVTSNYFGNKLQGSGFPWFMRRRLRVNAGFLTS